MVKEALSDAVLIPVDAPKPTLDRVKDALLDAIGMQRDRWSLWAPVAFGGGCALYFALPTEPALWPLALMAALASALWWGARRRGAGRAVTVPLMLLACLALGLAAGKWRTERIDAPIAPAMTAPTTVEGWVVDVDSPGQRGSRVVLAPVRIRGLAAENTPVRLRATLQGEPPPPGSAIRVFAILNPPPPPASPGAYDFGRNAYFLGMGGVAFALSETRTADLPEPPKGLSRIMALNGARYALASRIVARLGERTGGVAAAMTTGHETWIGQDDLDNMRDSGLAHILSISGLHMAIVGGFVFFAVRLGVAAVPWLALRISGKKVAAVAGLIAVGGYLLVSGGPPPAERAAVTASIAFLAVLLDRRAISMNALAVAAFVVLAFRPESIVQPGFQMSFAATAALVALAESWPARTREISAPFAIVAVQRFGGWLFAACMASLVAGLATGPFAMQHFNRTAIFGLLANVTTAPVSSFVMMPFLALGAVLEPFGLGGPFLMVAGWGVDAMLAIGAWTAALPGAVRTIASAPDFTLPIAFLGVLILCLWKGRGRWFGLPLAVAVMVWPRAEAPDVWIGDGGSNGAWRQDRAAVVMRPGVRQFPTDLWTQRRGLAAVEPAPEALSCARYGCRPVEAGVLALSWGRRPLDAEAIAAMCASAEVVSLRSHAPALPVECCDRLVLDAVDYARGGAVELWREGTGWRAVWTSDVRGDRPWTRTSDPD
jgi:competence protein ComEC